MAQMKSKKAKAAGLIVMAGLGFGTISGTSIVLAPTAMAKPVNPPYEREYRPVSSIGRLVQTIKEMHAKQQERSHAEKQPRFH